MHPYSQFHIDQFCLINDIFAAEALITRPHAHSANLCLGDLYIGVTFTFNQDQNPFSLESNF